MFQTKIVLAIVITSRNISAKVSMTDPNEKYDRAEVGFNWLTYQNWELRTRLETIKVFHWWTRENRRKIRTKGKTWWWWRHYWKYFGCWFHCGKNLPRIAGRYFLKYYCDYWCRRFDISRDSGFSNSWNRSLWQLTRQE